MWHIKRTLAADLLKKPLSTTVTLITRYYISNEQFNKWIPQATTKLLKVYN